jgi:hypothetical protein
MLFRVSMSRSYVVQETAHATIAAASKDEAIEAAMDDMDALPWETIDEEPNQDMETVCESMEDGPADFRVVDGALVGSKP